MVNTFGLPLDKGKSETQPDESELVITYPDGCVQGYCHKLWTLISIAATRSCAAEMDIKVLALVQGDN